MNHNLRILIVDDDRRMASTLADILHLQGYITYQANNPYDALAIAKETELDCVISDIIMPGMNGAELCDVLRNLHPDLTIVLMTAFASNQLTSLGIEKGALTVLEKPLDVTQVLQFLSLLQKNQTIAVVDNDPLFCQTLGDILKERGYQVKTITDPHAAVDHILGEEQVILLDLKFNGITGYDVMVQIREKHPDLPILLITGHSNEMGAVIEQAMAVNAYACLYKPLVISDLLKTLAEIRSGLLKRILGNL